MQPKDPNYKPKTTIIPASPQLFIDSRLVVAWVIEDGQVSRPVFAPDTVDTVDSSDGVFLPLMTVAQHQRIVAAMQQDLDYFPTTVRALTETIVELRAALSVQQPAPERVSVPRDLLADLISSDHDTRIQAERALYALLASQPLERGADV